MFCWCGIQLYEASCSNLGALLCPRHDPCVCGNSDICGLGNICTHYKSEEFENLPMFRPLSSDPVTLTYESEPVLEPDPVSDPDSDQPNPNSDYESDEPNPNSDYESDEPEPPESSDEDPFGDVPERY